MSEITNNKLLNSRILGTGSPLLILHGLYGSGDNWLTIGSRLAKYFTVHLLDLRNHGRSFHSKNHNYTVMSEDITYYLDHHNIEKCILAGHSMGGKVAMRFTLTHSQRVKKLIVMDIAPRSYQENSIEHLLILDTMLDINIEKLTDRKTIAQLALDKLKKEKLTHLLLKNIYRNDNGTFSWRLNVKTLRENLLEISDGTKNWKKTQVSTPTMFLKGEYSNYLQDSDNFFIQSFFINFELKQISDAGHWLHVENSQSVTNEILNFVSE